MITNLTQLNQLLRWAKGNRYMSNLLQSDPRSSQGLGIFSYKVTSSGVYTIAGTITLPSTTTGDPASSQIVVTMNVNGGASFYTGALGAKGFKAGIRLTSGDTVNVVLTSATAVDNALNAVRTTIEIY